MAFTMISDISFAAFAATILSSSVVFAAKPVSVKIRSIVFFANQLLAGSTGKFEAYAVPAIIQLIIKLHSNLAFIFHLFII
jgi:hypothetical protein